MPQNTPRGDLLENYRRENRAAPKPGHPRVHDIARTIYDGEVPAPEAGFMSTPPWAPQGIYACRLAPPEPADGGSGTTLGQKVLTSEKKDQCLFGDTRWPPPNVSISMPLHMLGDKGEKPIYYHLMYEDSSPQVDFRKGSSKA
jgi:hypothetical protein